MHLSLISASTIGIKSFKYFIDSKFRKHVEPVSGSVVYSDLLVAVEHSGIYIENGKISNIVVDSLVCGSSQVKLSDAQDFTQKSKLGKKIYVSCDENGNSVGDVSVANSANSRVGEFYKYNLLFKNCHHFSANCVGSKSKNESKVSLIEKAFSLVLPDDWEPSLQSLKSISRKKLNAKKWLLWDWNNTAKYEPEPDWQAHQDYFKDLPLNDQNIKIIEEQRQQTQIYLEEIDDEGLPNDITNRLVNYQSVMKDIEAVYRTNKTFITMCKGADLSYNDFTKITTDLGQLTQIILDNKKITELTRKLGRQYISEEKKKQTKIPTISKSEVYGTHRSDDLLRLLPTELMNLEDEALEYLFYARMLEQQLMTYELAGSSMVNGETTETNQKQTGPVVACVDTSSSMNGMPLLKAKATLVAIANILKKEKRVLHVLLFGSAGQLKEFVITNNDNIVGLLKFLELGFNDGTDFETPLQRAITIIKESPEFKKADVLMLTDGLSILSEAFKKQLKQEQAKLDFMIYTVLCAGTLSNDDFSDEVIVL